MKTVEFLIMLVLSIALAFAIALWVPGPPMDKLKIAIAYGGLILLFLFGFLVLAAIASNKIDISQLLEEKGTGGASMGRFQFLIFTLVIGLSFFLVVLCKCDIPDVPGTVLALLGVSATTYGVGKGIEASTKDRDGGQPGADGGPAGGGPAGGNVPHP
jgi:FtsH-binding integral membrane protein